MTGRRRALLTLAAAAVGLATAGYATTVVTDDTAPSTTAVTATTVPTGTTAELLERLVTDLEAISATIGGPGDEDALIAEAEAIWTAVRADVTATDPATAESMQRMMDLARTGVDRNRPADTDKAARFLGQLVDDVVADS